MTRRWKIGGIAALVAIVVALGAGPALASAPDGGYLGVELDEGDTAGTSGARIYDVEEGSPAAKAGLKAGFLVVKCNGKGVKNATQFIEMLVASSPGDKLKLEIQNEEGWRRDVEVTLGGQAKKATRPFLGVTIDNADRGIVIRSVVGGSPAEEAGLKTGDLILKANGKVIENTDVLGDVMAGLAPGNVMKLQVERDGWEKGLQVKLGSREVEVSQPAGRSEEVERKAKEAIEELERKMEKERAEKEKQEAEEAAAERKPAYLGVQLNESDEHEGLLIETAFPEGPAARSGIQAGDILVRLDGKAVKTFDALREILGDHHAGDVVSALVIRKGEKKELEVKLGARR